MLSDSKFTFSSSSFKMTSFSSNSSSFSLSFVLSNIKLFASCLLSSSLNLRNSFAVKDCFCKGVTCLSSSVRISEILIRLFLSFSSFLIATFFLLLYFVMPAASSKSSLLSSGFPEIILSTCP